MDSEPKESYGAGSIRWEDGQWYFYDESGAYRHGPFADEFDAAKAFVSYVIALTESSHVQEEATNFGTCR